MENFEKTWSTTITELIKTFKAELIKDVCQVYSVAPLGRPKKQDRQYKMLAYFIGEQNLFQKEDYWFEGAKDASSTNNPIISATAFSRKQLRRLGAAAIMSTTGTKRTNNICRISGHDYRYFKPHKGYQVHFDVLVSQLGGLWVWWFPGEWKLAQRKSHKIFQASFRFPANTTKDAIYSKFTPNGESLLQYMRAAAWKTNKADEFQDALTNSVEEEKKQQEWFHSEITIIEPLQTGPGLP
ncbi:hypothetical protein RclHR1_13680005 [Rhizophagus clarus]|uniref:Uncharacterized protein n=1 Tax=Rhizophagus clarus TaxID=94130 RepID=A0A2Z6QF54_9GLOM|nr:hypothetical protein RclHR1_13680005 [Rhizophagus clarus]